MSHKTFVVRYSSIPRWLTLACLLMSLATCALWVLLKFDQSRPPEKRLLDLSSVQEVFVATFAPDSRQRLATKIVPVDHFADESATAYGFSAHEIYRGPGLGIPSRWLALCLLAIPPALTFWLFLIGKDNQLLFSSQGITFPGRFMVTLAGRLRRKWDDISAISLFTPPNGHKELVVHFSSGGKANLRLSLLTEDERDTLLMALEELGAQCALAPELIALRHKLMAQQESVACVPSHTAMWEEELRFHFAATNFVPLATGKLLQNGRFKVIMQLAAGGLSAVYLAEQNQEVVVLKEAVVPPSADDKLKQKARELFSREAQLLVKLSHPRIARVRDYFVEDGRDYLVLDYIPGHTLREVVKRSGPQDEAKVRQWAAEIADMLQHLHEQDPPMVHRDITPDNLILNRDGHIHLIDFGAANQFVGSATGTLIGKQSYISPEQFRGKAEPASDIYSLGATLHFLLTGKDPEALSQSRPKTLRPELSDGIDRLVAACTECDTEDRIGNTTELLESLKDNTAVCNESRQTAPERSLTDSSDDDLPTAEHRPQIITLKQAKSEVFR